MGKVRAMVSNPWKEKGYESLEDIKLGIRCEYDYWSGEGEIAMTKQLARENVIMRLDVISDWMHDICGMYDKTMEEFKEWCQEVQKENGHTPEDIHEGHEPQGGVYDH